MRILETSLGSFPIPTPTVEDRCQVAHMMREQARKALPSPLEYVTALAGKVPAAVLEVAIRQAVQLGSGGGSMPTLEFEQEQYATEEGLAQRLYYHIHKSTPAFTLVQAQEIIRRDGRWTVLDRLENALLPLQEEDAAKKDDGPTGTGS